MGAQYTVLKFVRSVLEAVAELSCPAVPSDEVEVDPPFLSWLGPFRIGPR
jgi:hypothetical protein